MIYIYLKRPTCGAFAILDLDKIQQPAWADLVHQMNVNDGCNEVTRSLVPRSGVIKLGAQLEQTMSR